MSPNLGYEEYKSRVDEIFEEVRTAHREALIVGDLNVKSPLWGFPRQTQEEPLLRNGWMH